ncbi:hypothetical protein [Nocardia takedensis]|uniref:hypothetical protein n=1 Tax=Nocardia takedensis TaxID=259390 RepID=UPI00031E2705|nr:hypothetical protein [Nocardia takedensis]
MCQICADPLTDPVVVFVRPLDYLHGYAAEPGCHPECAHYSTRGCPMLNGTQHHHAANTAARYTRCADPDCACRFWIPQTDSARQGRPADAWYQMWLRRTAYRVVADPHPDPDLDQPPEPRVLIRGVPYLKLRKVRDGAGTDSGRPDPLELMLALRAATGY